MTIPRDKAYSKPPRWDRLYAKHFPTRTDPYSRHVVMFTEVLRNTHHPLRAAVAEYFEPDHIAQSMELAVKMLWEAREKLESDNA